MELSANGPAVVAWLESTDADLSQQVVGAHQRKIKAWKEGEDASLRAIDEVCTKTNLHLSMVPAEVWHG